MITLLCGTPGSGKSAFAVDFGLEHVLSGGCVISNFSLVDDWHSRFASHHILSRFSDRFFRDLSHRCYNRWWTYNNIDDLWQFPEIAQKYLSDKMRKQFEGRFLLIIDEAQLIFNSRNWQKNMGWIEFFSQHRKLGYDVYLIAHDDQMIDTQCRSFIEMIVRMRNLYHVRLPIPFIHIRLCWLFGCRNSVHARWHYYGQSALGGEVVKNRFARLSLWKLQLYDSLRLFRVGDGSGGPGLRRIGSDPRACHDAAVRSIASVLSDMATDLRSRRRGAPRRAAAPVDRLPTRVFADSVLERPLGAPGAPAPSAPHGRDDDFWVDNAS